MVAPAWLTILLCHSVCAGERVCHEQKHHTANNIINLGSCLVGMVKEMIKKGKNHQHFGMPLGGACDSLSAGCCYTPVWEHSAVQGAASGQLLLGSSTDPSVANSLLTAGCKVQKLQKAAQLHTSRCYSWATGIMKFTSSMPCPCGTCISQHLLPRFRIRMLRNSRHGTRQHQ